MAIKPQFESAGLFSDGLAPVVIGGKYGFINTEGTFVINPQFEAVFYPSIDPSNPSNYSFSDGLAAVQVEKKWGYIDKTGRFAISPQFDVAHFFVDGLAAVAVGNKWGYIDKAGNYVINPQFDWAGNFVDGVASVRVLNKGVTEGALIDRDGKLTMLPQAHFAHIDATPYSRPEWPAGLEVAGGKWGFVNKSGVKTIEPQYDVSYTSYFHEGLAPVKVNGKYGFVDTSGKMVIEPQFEVA